MADASSQVLLGSGLTVLSQPLMYVKVLVQVRAGMAGLRGGYRARYRPRGRYSLPVPAAGGLRAAAAHPREEHLRPPGVSAARPLLLR